MASVPVAPIASSLRPVRAALTGAVVLLVQFILCWLAIFVVGSGPTHMFIELFTAQPAGSTAALIEGGLWSVVFGALTGVLVAVAYNVLRFIRA
jgi:hypothetical protein